MFQSPSSNSWFRVVVVSMMLCASASIRHRGLVAAFSSVDISRTSSRSFHSFERHIRPSRSSICSSGVNSDVPKSRQQAWPHQPRTSLKMSTSSPASVPTTQTVLRRVKAVDATEATDGNPVLIKGWVRTLRKQKTLAFVEVNDGSNMKGIQCVLSFDSIDDETLKGMVMIYT